MKEQPFRLTFTLRTPMVEAHTDKTLDAVLSWAAVQRAEYQNLAEPFAVQHDLPLARHQAGDDWCFMASNLSYAWVGERGAVHYIKRQRAEDYANAWLNGLLLKLNKSNIDMTRGSSKAATCVQSLRAASAVTAWGIGDIEEIKKLLPFVTHIGKLHHHDHGAVARWEITEDKASHEKWKYRVLPFGSSVATGASHALSTGGLIAPYWNRGSHKRIFVPV